MGDSEFRGGQHVSVYVAHAWGDAIVATLGQTQSRGGRAISGLVEVQALATAQIAGCPLWVISGPFAVQSVMSALPPKADISVARRESSLRPLTLP